MFIFSYIFVILPNKLLHIYINVYIIDDIVNIQSYLLNLLLLNRLLLLRLTILNQIQSSLPIYIQIYIYEDSAWWLSIVVCWFEIWSFQRYSIMNIKLHHFGSSYYGWSFWWLTSSHWLGKRDGGLFLGWCLRFFLWGFLGYLGDTYHIFWGLP